MSWERRGGYIPYHEPEANEVRRTLIGGGLALLAAGVAGKVFGDWLEAGRGQRSVEEITPEQRRELEQQTARARAEWQITLLKQTGDIRRILREYVRPEFFTSSAFDYSKMSDTDFALLFGSDGGLRRVIQVDDRPIKLAAKYQGLKLRMAMADVELYYERDGRLSRSWFGSNTIGVSGVREVEAVLRDQSLPPKIRLGRAAELVFQLPSGIKLESTVVPDFLHPKEEKLAVQGVHRFPTGRVMDVIMAEGGQVQLTVVEPFYTPHRGR